MAASTVPAYVSLLLFSANSILQSAMQTPTPQPTNCTKTQKVKRQRERFCVKDLSGVVAPNHSSSTSWKISQSKNVHAHPYSVLASQKHSCAASSPKVAS